MRHSRVLVVAVLFVLLPPATRGTVHAAGESHLACGLPTPDHASCLADVEDQPAVISGLNYAQFHIAYNLPCTPGGPVASVCAAPSSYAGQPVIGIVDAYHNPNVESNLAYFDSYFGLPPCTTANGCLRIIDQSGNLGGATSWNSGWGLEEDLDVQVAHMICQTCAILVVETVDNGNTNLALGANEAYLQGATEISNSYGESDFSGETQLDQYYNHPGVGVTAAAGDWGYGAYYPASSPYVLGVGGTTLHVNGDGTYAGETAWSGDSSGCSAYERAKTWQTAVGNWPDLGCKKTTQRAAADVAADADPGTGALIYSSGWYTVGGTSLGSPLIAAAIALAGGVPAGTQVSSIPYGHPGAFHDVTSGGTKGCGQKPICTAVLGYDGPTGLGSPNGVGGL